MAEMFLQKVCAAVQKNASTDMDEYSSIQSTHT